MFDSISHLIFIRDQILRHVALVRLSSSPSLLQAQACAVAKTGCGGRIRTCDSRLMRPNGWPLPYTAINFIGALCGAWIRDGPTLPGNFYLYSRLQGYSMYSSVAIQKAFIKCLATHTTCALDRAVTLSTYFFLMGEVSVPHLRLFPYPRTGLVGQVLMYLDVSMVMSSTLINNGWLDPGVLQNAFCLQSFLCCSTQSNLSLDIQLQDFVLKFLLRLLSLCYFSTEAI